MKYIPEDGFAWNPTLKFPRNNPCYCGSGKKFKKCCLTDLSRAIPLEYADKFRAAVQHIRETK